MKFSFKPDETIEKPEVAWAGPVRISYWARQRLVQLEAFGMRNGEQHVVRSFTLRGCDLARSPELVNLLRRAFDDIERATVEAKNGFRSNA